MRGTRLAITAALAIALAAPATAQSPAVLYEGKSSQGRAMKLWATPEGDITEVRQNWRASCRRPGFRVRAGTRWLDPIEQSGTQMSDSGTYRVREGRTTLVITGEFAGTFENGRGGEGTARYRVRVRRRGRLIDRCRTGTFSWSVARSG
jgi:hypothetical protein